MQHCWYHSSASHRFINSLRCCETFLRDFPLHGKESDEADTNIIVQVLFDCRQVFSSLRRRNRTSFSLILRMLVHRHVSSQMISRESGSIDIIMATMKYDDWRGCEERSGAEVAQDLYSTVPVANYNDGQIAFPYFPTNIYQIPDCVKFEVLSNFEVNIINLITLKPFT